MLENSKIKENNENLWKIILTKYRNNNIINLSMLGVSFSNHCKLKLVTLMKPA
jgi:hypothetical protein